MGFVIVLTNSTPNSTRMYGQSSKHLERKETPDSRLIGNCTSKLRQHLRMGCILLQLASYGCQSGL